MKDKEFELQCEPELEFGLSGHWKKRRPVLSEDEFGRKLWNHLKPSKPLFIPPR